MSRKTPVPCSPNRSTEPKLVFDLISYFHMILFVPQNSFPWTPALKLSHICSNVERTFNICRLHRYLFMPTLKSRVNERLQFQREFKRKWNAHDGFHSLQKYSPVILLGKGLSVKAFSTQYPFLSINSRAVRNSDAGRGFRTLGKRAEHRLSRSMLLLLLLGETWYRRNTLKRSPMEISHSSTDLLCIRICERRHDSCPTIINQHKDKQEKNETTVVTEHFEAWRSGNGPFGLQNLCAVNAIHQKKHIADVDYIHACKTRGTAESEDLFLSLPTLT